MTEIDVVWLYEKALRELDVACAVKVLLERLYGLRVEIVQQNYGSLEAIKNFLPRLVLLPFCYQNTSNNIFLVWWREAIFVNLTWEQLLYPGNRIAKTPRGEFPIHHVLHHAWSKGYADFLKRQGVPAQHIFLNGNPAYALYDEPYRFYFKQRQGLAEQHGLDPSKRWIFFPENYNWAFYSQRMLTQMIEDGQKPEDVTEMREFCMHSFEAVIRWCRALAEHENIEIIVRPRPATGVDDFVKRIKEIIATIPDRMHIHQQETVREWVLASDAVISSYSTSLIESAIAGKASYMVEPYPFPHSLRQGWHELLPHITSRQEFLSILSNATGNEAGKQLGEWARATMLSSGDPIGQLADYIAQLLHGEIYPPPKATRQSVTMPGHDLFPGWFRYGLRKFRQWGALHIPGVAFRIPSEDVYDVAVQKEIPQRLEKWEHILDNYCIQNKN